MRSFFGRSAVVAATLLSSSFILSATSSVAETPLPLTQQQKQEKAIRSETSAPSSTSGPTAASSSSVVSSVVIEATDPAGGLNSPSESRREPAPVHYTATAYSLYGKTASGKHVGKGLIAADPSLLPLGTRVRLDAGNYSGEYLVADTGGAVRGKRIDIWTPSSREAMRFGKRLVKLTVLSYGPRRLSLRRQRTR